MPLGPFGEVIGTTGTLDDLGPSVQNYETKVIAPRNPKLVRGDPIQIKMKPSQFLFQMTLDTTKKLANTHNMYLPKKVELLDMSETTHQRGSEQGQLKTRYTQVDVEEAIFQPFPSEIFFMNCEPHETHELNLQLRNNDKVPRLVKVTHADSPYFKIISPNSVGSKVAAGLSTNFIVQFTPDERRDYTHELICITEREKFIVPVHCVGARAILDFPDEVNFPPVPVKHTEQRTLFVRNVGNREAKFSMTTEKPFAVSPASALLNVNESFQVTVDYFPQTANEHIGELVIHYDTTEKIYVKLYGVAQDVSVRLDKQAVRVENTYVGLANQRVVTLNNRSDVIAKFRWTRFSTLIEQEMERNMMLQLLSLEENSETSRFLDECDTDPSLKDKLAIVSRTFLNKKRLMQNDGLLFEDDVIKIDPVEGEIWPNSSREVTVTFKPVEAREYQRLAFCDVTGRETRLALKVTGVGVGPKIQFSFSCLDMGFIFIGSTHTYELVLANKGDIDAMYKIQPGGSSFSNCFKFTPDDGLINPGGHQAIHINFKSSFLGDFVEDFKVMFDGCPEPVTVTFKGTVIGPTFHFDRSKLKFGAISYGFTVQEEVVLHNTSLVAMTYKLRVPGDGSGDPIHADDMETEVSPRGHYHSSPPREFDIEPSTGTIQPMSATKILIKLTSNYLRKYNTGLVVDVVNVGDEVLTLPISARSVVPPIRLSTPVLQYSRCFLDYPYEQNVSLVNDADIPAKYELLPQDVDNETDILFHSSQPKGIIQPRSICEVPLFIRATGREEVIVEARFKIFGSEDPPLEVEVRCYGEGPVVCARPEEFNWGQVPVLSGNKRQLVLSNESLIKAKFSAKLLRPDTVFFVEPESGEIEPEQSVALQVYARLNDCMKFQDKLQVDIENSQPKIVPLCAIGCGTTVSFEPPMNSQLVLEPHFSQTPLQKVFKLTNQGRRHQQLVWSTEGYSYTKAAKQAMSANSGPMSRPIFSIVPHRFDLAPGESIDVKLTGQVNVPQVVKERLLCHAIIGRQGGKELIKKVDVTVDFISPILEFSSKSLVFKVNKSPSDTIEVQTQELVVRNVSGLGLSTLLKLKYPFQILVDDGSESSDYSAHLEVGESATLNIQFDPLYREDTHSRRIEDVITVTYYEHPHVDYIELVGQVSFPNMAFESSTVDFGSILNHTEVTRYLSVTNNSPMAVRYKWSFLVGDKPNLVFHRQKKLATARNIPFKETPVIVDAADKDEGTEKVTGQEQGGESKTMNDEEAAFQDEEGVPALDLPTNDDDDDEEAVEARENATERSTGRPESVASSQQSNYVNPVLQKLLEQDTEVIPLGIEEVFDILPLYGEIGAGQSEQFTLTFFGHADVEAQVTALCEVEGGPSYELQIRGEASFVQYELSQQELDYGKIPYDQISMAEFRIFNSGKVGFEYTTTDEVVSYAEMDNGRPVQSPPMRPMLSPASGFIPPHSSQTVSVRYLPGIPEKFSKSFQIQVAHFPPDTMLLRGVGTFPRISLDLPRLYYQDSEYENVACSVRQEDHQNVLSVSRREVRGDTEAAHSLLGESQTLRRQDIAQGPGGAMSELEVQMEVERRTVAKFAEAAIARPDQHAVEAVHAATQVLTMPGQSTGGTTGAAGAGKRGAKGAPKQKKMKAKPVLPAYLLDFGYVVLGHVRSHIVRATNTGYAPVSCWIEKDHLPEYGFNMVMNRFKDLPGAPTHDTLDFVISFDPRGANLQLGPVETILPLSLVGGPYIPIRLRAHVTMPDLAVNNDVVDFESVRCGDAKVITVQLHNPTPVLSEWTSCPLAGADSEDGRETPGAKKKRADRFTPMHLRRKQKAAQAGERSAPPSFEMIPTCGELKPGQRMNVQIKFMPCEARSYDYRMSLRIAQSSQRLLILCRGSGLEPRLEFVDTLVRFGPILPYSNGDERAIVIRNPCNFPIEMYNLEFDKFYLEEEKILRQMVGYDEHNTLLLPPRAAGEKLPPELIEFYEEQVRKVEEVERAQKEAEMSAGDMGDYPDSGIVQIEQAAIPLKPGEAPISDRQPTTSLSRADTEAGGAGGAGGVGDLEITPVSMAIARYLGIDLSPEGKAARNRRGIAILVHGAPQSGKTTTAVMLAKRYEAALLTVDGVIIEAISNGNTASGRRAREMCAEAARRAAEAAEAEEAAQAAAAAAQAAVAGGGAAGAGAASGDGKKTGLSVEAVAAHTQGQGAGVAAAQSMAQSMVSNRKTSTVSGPGQPIPHGKHAAGSKDHVQPAGGAKGGAQGDLGAASQPPSETDLKENPNQLQPLISLDQEPQNRRPSSLQLRESPVPSPTLARRLTMARLDLTYLSSSSIQRTHLQIKRGSLDLVGRQQQSHHFLYSNLTTIIPQEQLRLPPVPSTKSTVPAVVQPVSSSRSAIPPHLHPRLPSSALCLAPVVPSSPQPLTAPIARRLSISASLCGEESLMSTILSEDLIVEILSERLLLSDCHRGVVFDSLETLFASNMTTSTQCVLKALNNRRYIFNLTLKQDFAAMKAKLSRESELEAKRQKEAEEKERVRLEEMDEDEYDALSEAEKTRVDSKRLEIKKERRRKEMEEKEERERQEREQLEAELRRLEEEKYNDRLQMSSSRRAMKKKGGKKGAAPAADEKAKAAATAAAAAAAKSKEAAAKPMTRESTTVRSQGAKTEGMDRPESHATEKSDGKHDSEKKKSGKGGDKSLRPKSGELGKDPSMEMSEDVKEPMKESDRLLQQKFKTFEHDNRTIVDLLAFWDRTTLSIRRPPTASERSELPPTEEHAGGAGARSGKTTNRGGGGAGKKGGGGKEHHHQDKTSAPAAAAVQPEAGKDGHHEGDHTTPEITTDQQPGDCQSGTTSDDAPPLFVPNIIVDCTSLPGPSEVSAKVLELNKLPRPEEVLDGLGMGDSGPPIPPPATFSITPYPVKRRAPIPPPVQVVGPPGSASTSVAATTTVGASGGVGGILGHYQFVAATMDDPNMAPDLTDKEEEEKSGTPDKLKEDIPTKGKGKRGGTGGGDSSSKDKTPGPPVTKESRRISGKKTQRRGSELTSPVPTPLSEDEHSANFDHLASMAMSPALGTFRWIVPANGEVTLRLRFKSEELGQFDQTLNFELMGTQRRYQLYCRGVCSFPTISREPRVVFPHRKKSKASDEIVNKKYILTSETFEFGPMFVEKLKEKVREGNYPDNIESLTIHNTSPMEADISFCLLKDFKSETFALEPTSMVLQPGESQEMTIWCYPRSPGRYEDAIVCCVKENPEPILFKLACDGVRPELELDKKVLHFDKVLLHRKDTKTIQLRNSTLLPVTWKIGGLEALGEDFSMGQDSGVIEALSEFSLNCYFRAMKPYKPNQKKSIRLEVYDMDNIAGLVQVENLQVLAEAYDVALDMSFPKGADGGIDFGVTRVGEETKQSITLRNKGPYEISFQFVFEDAVKAGPKVNSLFSIFPERGTLASGDKAFTVQIVYKARDEVTIRDEALLKCQIIEPSLGEVGEMIASIPIRVSVRSVYSKFGISPKADINFGAIIVQNKKTRQFIIDNSEGEFDFRYSISKMVRGQAKEISTYVNPKDKQKSQRRKAFKHRPFRSSDSSDRRKRKLRQDAAAMLGGQTRLQLGMFTISPSAGNVPVGSAQIVTIDCVAETPARCDEELSIDITDRNPNTGKYGVPYRLIAEACIPAITTTDIASVFEEHRICRTLNLINIVHEFESGGIYGEDENRFVFPNVIVGCKSKARFRITNAQKVPCDINLSVRSGVHARSIASRSSGATEVFEVEPTRTQVPPHSYVFATVSFTPTAMQQFSTTFEATIEGMTSSQPRGKSLTFEITGEGNLPRINIDKPVIRNKRGQPLCLFRKLLVSKREAQPLVITNDGFLPSRVDIDLVDPDGVFTLKACRGNKAIMNNGDVDNIRHPHTASLTVGIGETVHFEVVFHPHLAQRCVANVKLAVINNQYEDSIVQLIGEGYEDEVSFENLPEIDPCLQENVEPTPAETDEKVEADEAPPPPPTVDEIQAAKNNLIHFGDCAIGEDKSISFNLVNHSSSDIVRYAWPTDHPQLRFSPSCGHLPPGNSRLITVTMNAGQPVTLVEKVVSCKLAKIVFTLAENEVPVEWDDTKKTMKWVDILESRPDSSSGPLKRKVVEVEPEPAFTEVVDTTRNLDLLVSVTADYAKLEKPIDRLRFKDTLLFQTRHFDIPLINKGTVALSYQWEVLMDIPSTPSTPRPGTPASDRSSLVRASELSPPISIEPTSGSVPPGKTGQVRVRYSPLAVGAVEGRLVCIVKNLEGGEAPFEVQVSGRSLQPLCHFDLEDSDYVSGARRNPELRGPGGSPAGTSLDQNTRVIEVDAVGVGGRIVKKFSIVNPTNQPYSFSWLNDDLIDVRQPAVFNCMVKDGVVMPGKKVDLEFDFTPHTLGTVESFWKFRIAEHDITVPFLLVCHTREPELTLDRSHFNYRSLLVGHEAMETVHLINPENQAFHFAFQPETMHAPGFANSIRVEPSSGVVPANSKMPLNLFFTPKSETEVNFNLVCKVPRKLLPLTLNVKADGYTMKSEIWIEDRVSGSGGGGGHKQEVTTAKPGNIDFGELEIREQVCRQLIVSNTGKFNFDYTWEVVCPRSEQAAMITVTPAKGGVIHGQKALCQLMFVPSAKVKVRNCQLLVHISNGPTYTINLTGSAQPPGLQFSFTRHDFGPCFVHQQGMDPATVLLTITNQDHRPASLDCLTQASSHLQHNFEPKVLAPGATYQMKLTFLPREAVRYRETLEFEVNGMSRHSVEVLGVGTDLRVEVSNPRHRVVKLGTLKVEEKTCSHVVLVNHSLAPVTFRLVCNPTRSDLQEPGVLTITPTGREISLPARGGQTQVEVKFVPGSRRIAQFVEEVSLEWASLSQPVFAVSGACHGYDIQLDNESVAFGAVVKGSQLSKRLIMTNHGDIGAKFKWATASFGPEFSIHPVEGYISPGMNVPFDIVFKPSEISADIRKSGLKCHIEGWHPVPVTLTGMCIQVTPVKETQHFAAFVRQKDTKPLQIVNRTNATWILKPVIEGEYWSGPETLTVEAQSTRPYELTYRPLTMTTDGKKHTGWVFFALPDGTGLLYNVTGSGEPPRAVTKLTRDIPCKAAYVEVLPVANWLPRGQRFKVTRELVKPDKLDAGTHFKGLDYIDVPGDSQRDYKFNFYAHKEGQTIIKVTFTNEQTSEYLFFELMLKAGRPNSVGLIKLTTPVRQAIQHTLSLDNPLNAPVTFQVQSSLPEIHCPAQLQIPPQSEGSVSFEFLPLRVADYQGKLEFNCNELGLYGYDLDLNATPAGLERALFFRANIGTQHALTARFINYSKAKMDFTCKVDNSDFHCDKIVTAAPGVEVGLEVTYQPTRLGDTKATLIISSAQAGDYIFPLQASALPPKPQGPFTVKAGATCNITFKNVFSSTTPYTMQVDNPAFHIPKSSESIRANKDHRIVVGFDGGSDGGPVMGKLIVSCVRSAGTNANLHWVYYLRGLPS